MATYLPGVTDYIPQLQPFKPDFNFYAGALQMKQGKYDQAHKKLSTLYGSLLNAPMLRDQNVKARDQFFKTIDHDIKKMAGMDLSLQQNTDAAAGIFNQLLEDQNIVKDMVWTKNWRNEHQRAEGFRNCVDPEECGGSWWDGGVKALNYRADEFRKASAEQALGFSNAQFTPYQDVMKKAIDLANEAGLSIEMDTVRGRYIVTEKNGTALIRPLQSLFAGTLGKDPKIMEYYKTKAYVQRKDWIASNVPVYGSEEEATKAYINEMGGAMKQMFGDQLEEATSTKENITAQRKKLEDKIRTNGTTKNSSLANQYNKMIGLEQQLNDSHKLTQDTANRGKLMEGRDPSVSAGQLDQMLATYYLQGDIGAAAQTLAFKDYKRSLKADPYALENAKFANRVALENMRFEHDKLLKMFDYDLKKAEDMRMARGDNLYNIPQIIKDVTGGADPRKGTESEFEQYKEWQQKEQVDISRGERELLGTMMQRTQGQSKTENGFGIASQDLLDFGEMLYGKDGYIAKGTGATQTASDLPTAGPFSGFARGIAGAAQAAKKGIAGKWQGMSKAQKLDYMQNHFDFGTDVKMNGLSDTMVDLMYENYALPLMDMTKEGNRVNRSYIDDLWNEEDYAVMRKDITLKSQTLDQMNNWYAKESLSVLDKVGSLDADQDYYQYKDMLQHYIDPETGGARSEEEFARSYADALTPGVGEEYEIRSGRNVTFTPAGTPTVHQGTPEMGRLTSERRDQMYQKNYQDAIDAYRGQKTGYEIKGGTGTLGAIRGLYEMARGESPIRETVESGPSIHKVWKKVWSKYAEPDGGSMHLNLSGFGSTAAQGLNYSMVDPAKYQSSGTMNTMSFLNNAFRSDNARFQAGGFSSVVPSNQVTYEKAMRQVYQDMIQMADFDEDKRPMLDVTYVDVAGSSDEWTAMNIKLNSKYVSQYKGSESTPGMFRGMTGEMLTGSGVTIYIPKDQADNALRQGVNKTAIEKSMYLNGSIPIDSYPQVTKDLKIEQLQSGGYYLTGSIQKGFDEQGNKTYTPITQTYADPLSDLNQIYSDWNALLGEVNRGVVDMEMVLNQGVAGIYDPAQLNVQ